MKDMQKISNNLKQKNKQIITRFTLQQEFINLTNAGSSEIQICEILKKEVNARQKLKIIKNIIDQPNQIQITIKKNISLFFTNLYMKQYVFGNTQSKPSLIPTIKKIKNMSAIGLQQLKLMFRELPLLNYQQARNGVELIDLVCVKQNIKEILKQQFPQIIKIILSQFNNCKQIVFGQSFKLRWLQHFVDLLRTTNLLVKLLQNNSLQQIKNIAIDCRKITSFNKILTKQVLAQLHLLIVYIQGQIAQQPTDSINKIYYFHARNVVLGQDVLQKLIDLLNTRDAQQKCQLVPILLKAFQQHFHNYKDKSNIFDQIVVLFQAGRSVYNYLQQILTIIIKDPQANWNLQGNYQRRFFTAAVALKSNVPVQVIFKLMPKIIPQLIQQTGYMTTPYAAQCANILFKKLYEQAGNFKNWSQKWMKPYNEALISQDRGKVRGIVDFINPILLNIDSNPDLLREVVQFNKQSGFKLTMGVISLLKCYKDLGKIQVSNKQNKFYHIDQPLIQFSKQQIQNLLLSVDTGVALKALQLVSVHPKSSHPMEPLQLDLVLSFLKKCMKTSLPQFRKSYLNAFKKMFERLRTVYESQVTTQQAELLKNKRYKPRNYYKQFKIFLNKAIIICYQYIYPDVIFQVCNPALQILLMIGQYFGRKTWSVRKTQQFQPAHILNDTVYFKIDNFFNLLCCLQSSYQSVRILSHEILLLFDHLKEQQILKQLWSQSLQNANKLSIKSYEYACRILSLISQVYPHIINLSNRYNSIHLNVCQVFLDQIKKRYEVFKNEFATQQQSYYKNLIHGLLTVSSYSLDYLASIIRNQTHKQIINYNQLKTFLSQFFIMMNQIILFSVQVCSSNVSTVVLDSIPQSQTDKKYKVDCRGHFLQQTTKSVGQMFQSTALLASMENQEEGIQNTLVVSFYLLTRQAGLVFQSIANLTATSTSSLYLPTQQLEQLVNTYFYALINLKHMGSVDRIATGLAKMSRLIFDSQNPKLSSLPLKLLDKLIQNLKLGHFTNILRRSAGVPYAFSCLLKSQAIRKKQMIQKTITSLIQMSYQKNQNNILNSIQIRIHSLNILKKLFQDGQLKVQLQFYVSQAFITSIKGFSSQDWGVRNSSLMLFTVLSNRTVGIKPTYNLIQFFHKCPDLLGFFTNQLVNMKLNTMYPPLYPMVLLLSRLLPFDVKQRVKIPNKGESDLKNIRKDKLLQLLPLIQKTGQNSNHMGRVMAAKAVIPFMQIQGILPYCINLLRKAKTLKFNNLLHFNLTTVYNLLTSLSEIQKQQKYEIIIDQNTAIQILQQLIVIAKLINRKQSAVISQLIIKIIHHVLNHYRLQFNSNDKYLQLLTLVQQICSKKINTYFKNNNLIIPLDMGQSTLIKCVIQLQIDVIYLFRKQPKNFNSIIQNYCNFLKFLGQKLKQSSQFLRQADTQVIQFYLNKITQFVQQHPNQQKLVQQTKNIVSNVILSQISSDNVLIQILNLRSILKICMTQQQKQYLQQIVNKTNNHFLEIAIFKYHASLNIQDNLLLKLLLKFSKPQQLQQLRMCCVQYLQKYNKQNKCHYIVYIRLLQDQDYQIRYKTAKCISLILNLPQINQQSLKYIILSKISLNDFDILLKQVSDFEIKQKNHNQQRIFSYDKPNKYRTDAQNLIYCLTNNTNLIAQKHQLASVIKKSLQHIKIQSYIQITKKYIKDVMIRDQYQFQILIRLYALQDQQIRQIINPVIKSHPLLQKLIDE